MEEENGLHENLHKIDCCIPSSYVGQFMGQYGLPLLTGAAADEWLRKIDASAQPTPYERLGYAVYYVYRWDRPHAKLPRQCRYRRCRLAIDSSARPAQPSMRRPRPY
jgi:hypothetical protein